MEYCNTHNIATFCKSFVPITYDLQISKERIAFFRQLPCDNTPNHEWLLKTMEHMGDGIYFIKNSNYLRNFYLSKQEQNISNPHCIIEDAYDIEQNLERESVAQQLIKSARINNSTFHIRAFMYVANYANPLIVLYAGSVVLRSTDPREIRTNWHQRKANFTGNVYAYILNLTQVSNYFGEAFDARDIIAQIKSATKILFLAAFEKNIPQKHTRVQHHMMPVLDFIVTDEFKVKWLDYNNPGGSYPTHCFEETETKFGIKVSLSDYWGCTQGKRMMEEMINIQIEIAIKKRNKQALDQLDSIKSFEVIVWE